MITDDDLHQLQTRYTDPLFMANLIEALIQQGAGAGIQGRPTGAGPEGGSMTPSDQHRLIRAEMVSRHTLMVELVKRMVREGQIVVNRPEPKK